MFKSDHRSLLAYTAVLCLCVAPAVRASLDEDLLFYAPFDGDTTAALARGNPEATHVLEPRFAPGLRGQALVIGGDPRVEQRIEDGLVDEFRIHGRPLREAEIRSLYLADASAVEHDTGLIVLGEHTPTQAGRIADDDYAFDATALETPGQVEVLLETSRVALSYDREAAGNGHQILVEKYSGFVRTVDFPKGDAQR